MSRTGYKLKIPVKKIHPTFIQIRAVYILTKYQYNDTYSLSLWSKHPNSIREKKTLNYPKNFGYCADRFDLNQYILYNIVFYWVRLHMYTTWAIGIIITLSEIYLIFCINKLASKFVKLCQTILHVSLAYSYRQSQFI